MGRWDSVGDYRLGVYRLLRSMCVLPVPGTAFLGGENGARCVFLFDNTKKGKHINKSGSAHRFLSATRLPRRGFWHHESAIFPADVQPRNREGVDKISGE